MSCWRGWTGLGLQERKDGPAGTRERIWVGIDAGKASHHASAVDAGGQVVFSRKVVNGQAGIEALIVRAGKAAGQVTWAVDITSGTAGLLLALLLAGGATR